MILACEQALLFGQAKRASRERASEGPAPRGFAARSHVLATLVYLAQIGELARRLVWFAFWCKSIFFGLFWKVKLFNAAK